MKLSNEFKLKDGTIEELNEIISQPNFKGCIRDLPSELYHSCLGVSRSTLNELDKSFSHYRHHKQNPKAPTRDTRFGSAFHDYTMLRDEFIRKYAVIPNNKVEGMVFTVEDIKREISKHIDTTELRAQLELATDKLASIEKSELEDSQKIEDEINKLGSNLPSIEESLAKYEDDLKNLSEESFENKKTFTEEQKRIKACITEQKNALKSLTAENKDTAKRLKDGQKEKYKSLYSEAEFKISELKTQIKSIESKLSGSKEVLIANLREFDKEIPIWDELLNKFKTENDGKEFIPHEDFLDILAMYAKVQTHPTLDMLLNGQHTLVMYELTFFWTCPNTGMLLKCRPDILIFTPNMVLPADYKTTDDASKDGFARSINKFKYHLQAPFYIDGINIVLDAGANNFLFIAVEKSAPHELALYALDSISISEGRSRYNSHLKTIQLFEEELKKNPDTWTGYPVQVQDISIPTYGFKLEA